MPDLSDFATAMDAVLDRRTSADDLAVVARCHPELRDLVAKHPHASPELVAWMASLGQPQVLTTADAARVRAGRFAQAWVTVLAVVIVVGVLGAGSYILVQHSNPSPDQALGSGLPQMALASGTAPTGAPTTPVQPLADPWTKLLGGTFEDRFFSATVVADGGIVAVGQFDSTDGDFGAKVGQTPGSAAVGLSADGAVSWFTMVPGDPGGTLTDVAATPDGHVVTTGENVVAELDASGAVVWSQPLDHATSNQTTGQHITVGPDGTVYISGQTTSTLGPLAPAIDTNTGDAFVAAYTKAGALSWSIVLGGHGGSQSVGLTVGPDGDIYAAVRSFSTDGNLPSGTSAQEVLALARLSSSGALLSATRLAEGGSISCNDLTTSLDGDLLMAGDAKASTGAVTTAHVGSLDATVTKLTLAGQVVWSTAVGGSGTDGFQRLAVAPDGSIDAVGSTTSTDGDAPMNGAPGNGVTDVMVASLSPDGTLRWAHSYGGSGQESGFGVAVAADGGVVAVGSAASTDGDLPAVRAQGSDEALIMRLSASGSAATR